MQKIVSVYRDTNREISESVRKENVRNEKRNRLKLGRLKAN